MFENYQKGQSRDITWNNYKSRYLSKKKKKNGKKNHIFSNHKKSRNLELFYVKIYVIFTW